jgi:hypothetical protein
VRQNLPRIAWIIVIIHELASIMVTSVPSRCRRPRAQGQLAERRRVEDIVGSTVAKGKIAANSPQTVDRSMAADLGRGDNVHILRRDTKYAAAQCFQMILANDERPRTMHAEAECTERELLPDIIGRLLDRHDARLAARRQDWREHTAAQRAFYERYQRLAADIGRAADRGKGRGYGLEL